MTAASSDRRWLWTGVGLAAGLAVAFVWPHEHAAAPVADRNDKFAMITAELDFTQTAEGVFILDFLTGQLRGAGLNPQTGGFSMLYARNVAADFNVEGEGTYAIVSGKMNPQRGARGAAPASSLIYIAELNSGQVIAYAFPLNTGRGADIATLTKVANFPFREASPE